jgi:hypothetical protein
MKTDDLGFTFRDIARYLVPGTVAGVLVVWFLVAFAGVSIEMSNVDFGDSVLFLLIAYALGHVLSVVNSATLDKMLGRKLESIAKEIADGKGGHFSPQFRDRLNQCVQSRFGVELSCDDAFDLCDCAIGGQPESREQERYAALSGLYGDLLMAVSAGIGMCLLVGLKHLALLILPTFNVIIPPTPFLDYHEAHLVLGVLGFVVLTALWFPVRREARCLCESMYLETYRAFYALSTKREPVGK